MTTLTVATSVWGDRPFMRRNAMVAIQTPAVQAWSHGVPTSPDLGGGPVRHDDQTQVAPRWRPGRSPTRFPVAAVACPGRARVLRLPVALPVRRARFRAARPGPAAGRPGPGRVRLRRALAPLRPARRP